MATVHLRPAERLVFFTDAVVAIAMTLLILPLLESVSDAAKEGLDTAGYLREHDGQLFAFALSFVIIAAFWRSHDHLFELVEKQDAVLLRLNVAWMFTIVWLPVATAIVGMMDNDPVQKTLYIGSLFATSVMMTVLGWYALRHPELHDMPVANLRSGILADAIASALFALAYLLTIVFPVLSYLPMFLLVLTGPLHNWLRRYLPH
jgi:uncharacterized membrane protein